MSTPHSGIPTPHNGIPTGCLDSMGHGVLLPQLAWPAGSLGTAMYLFHSSALVRKHPTPEPCSITLQGMHHVGGFAAIC